MKTKLRKTKLTYACLVLLFFGASWGVQAQCETPATPTLVSAEVNDCSSASIAWSEATGSTSHFYVYFCTAKWSSCHAEASPNLIDKSITSLALTGLTENTTYYYRIRAYSNTSGGCFSATDLIDSLNTGSCGTASIAEQQLTGDSDEITIAPNPVNDHCVIRLNGSWLNQQVHVEIVDLSGKTLVEYDGNRLSAQGETEVDLSKLARGTYILQVTDGNRFARQKLSKY